MKVNLALAAIVIKPATLRMPAIPSSVTTATRPAIYLPSALNSYSVIFASPPTIKPVPALFPGPVKLRPPKQKIPRSTTTTSRHPLKMRRWRKITSNPRIYLHQHPENLFSLSPASPIKTTMIWNQLPTKLTVRPTWQWISKTTRRLPNLSNLPRLVGNLENSLTL